VTKTVNDYPLVTNSVLNDDAISFLPDGSIKEFFDRGAILLVDKPSAWTSFDVVNKIRRLTKASKVGHCGTLDPFATGLLIVCSGKATAIVDQFGQRSKEYLAEFELGKTTDTLDCDGIIIEEKSVPVFTRIDLEAVCRKFVGDIEQTPPQYSAIKIGGQPAYKKARKGEYVDLQMRRVTVHRLEILHYENNILKVSILCSKGTYVRALARDIGNDLGCGAYVKSLRRTAIGEYAAERALSISQVTELTDKFKSSHVDH
jgi:tRNA pseudouridine55 synthase